MILMNGKEKSCVNGICESTSHCMESHSRIITGKVLRQIRITAQKHT